MKRIWRVVAVFLVGIAGWVVEPVWGADGISNFEVRRVVAEGKGGTPVPWAKAPSGGEKELQVEKEVLLRQVHIDKAEVEKDVSTSLDQVKVTLTKEGAEQFAKVTRNSVGQRLAIVVQGKVVAAPVIAQEIGGGMFVISGNFSASEVADLVKALGSGARL